MTNFTRQELVNITRDYLGQLPKRDLLRLIKKLEKLDGQPVEVQRMYMTFSGLHWSGGSLRPDMYALPVKVTNSLNKNGRPITAAKEFRARFGVLDSSKFILALPQIGSVYNFLRIIDEWK